MSFELFRVLVVMLPAAILVHQFVHKQHPLKQWVGGLFAHIWQFQWRLIGFAGGIQLGLWQFTAEDMLLFDLPVDAILGCGLLLGFLPRIRLPQLPLVILVIIDGLITFLLLPIDYKSSAIPFLIILSLVVILPSHWLARWTEHDKHLYLRSLLQNTSWAILLLWLFPSILFNLTDDSWTPFLQRSLWLNIVYLLPLTLPSGLIINALYEFAHHGKGTGFPYDSPKYLVTSGSYRYLSNPMQVGIVLMMAGWGAILESTLVMLSAPVALILFLVFKNVCNGSCQLGKTHADEWERYQQSVPKWIPFRNIAD